MGKINQCCLCCGERHNVVVPCPCPRCYHQHCDNDCLNHEDWLQFQLQSEFERFIGRCCRLCGESHGSLSACPCPRCFTCHNSADCAAVVVAVSACQICNVWHGADACEIASRPLSKLCALCNRAHDGNCASHINQCCLCCGERHNVCVPCPCPRCYHQHSDNDCLNPEDWLHFQYHGQFERFVGRCCRLCGESHCSLSACPCPRCFACHISADCSAVVAADSAAACQRCNVWHGADVCAQSELPDNVVYQPRHPVAMMRNRAVLNVDDERIPEIAAPAHSDAVSDCHNVGPMSHRCVHCGARFWKGESINCCYKGSLVVPEPDIPQSLSNLILSAAVRKNLRAYNMAMAMACVGHNNAGFPDGVFVLSGKSYHRIGSLVPNDGQPHCFAQIYMLDTAAAADRRSLIFSDSLDRQVLMSLHEAMLIHNRYASEFCRAANSDVHELVWSTDDNIMGMHIGAMVSAVGTKRTIVLQRQGDVNSAFQQHLQFIDDGHSLYHPLAYPLLFPTGSPGWFQGMTRIERESNQRRSVSIHDYGRYVLMHRERSVTMLICIDAPNMMLMQQY